MKRLAAVLLALALAPVHAADAPEFPRPPELRPAVQFWTQVYSRVGTDGGLIHDRDNLDVVYEVVRFGDAMSKRERVREVRERKQRYRDLLREIIGSDREELSAQAREVLGHWPDGVSDARLRRAVRGVRFQLGQADKFRAGLVRSGAWEPHIRHTLEDMGLPEELAALPHVESSFNPDAWSRVGAAGLWQFTRSTGRRYMRIDHVIDERMDPFLSSIAAARLLEHNYSVTGNWALAVTAYNHGLAGVRRAVRTAGTDDIGRLVREYNSRTWGFASRNFYAAFLAAVDVDFHAHQYFGIVDRHDPLVTETVELPFYATVDALAAAFEVDPATLRELNRALRNPVWEGRKRVPRGYDLRVPSGADRPDPREMLARVDEGARYLAQLPDREHRVRPGESLTAIARRYSVSTRELVTLNNLRSRHFIRAGQTLRLPVAADAGTTGGDGTYTVRRGDTLSGIARRVGLSVNSLAAANGLDDRHRIYPGQDLRVDGRAAKDVELVADAGEAADANEPAGGEAPASTAEETAATSDGAEDGDSTAVADASAEATGPEVADEVGESATPADADATIADADGATAEADTGASAEESPSADEADATSALEASEPTDAPAEEASTPQRLALSGGIASGPPARELAAMEPAGDAGDATEAADESHELVADPSDYAVADDGTIEVQAAETLGHYAEWLDLRASQLRRVNDMSYGTPVVVGERLALEFARVDPAEFERRRQGYHEELQARFFDQFRITGTRRQLVERGDSLWTLARRSDNVPVWLLRQYNPDLDFDELQPGMPVTLPTVERQPQSTDDAGGVQADASELADDAGA